MSVSSNDLLIRSGAASSASLVVPRAARCKRNVSHAIEVACMSKNASSSINSSKKRKIEKIQKPIEQPTEAVNIVEYKQFVEEILKMQAPDFSASFDRLKNFCFQSVVPSSEHRNLAELWIELPNGRYVLLQIIEREKYHANWYESNFLAQSELLLFDSAHAAEPNYFYVQLHDGDDFEESVLNNPIFKIRIDPQGVTAEVIALRNSQDFSGNRVKNELVIPLLDALNIKNSLWNDESKLCYRAKLDSIVEIQLRVAMPIVALLTDPHGDQCAVQTWYSKNGCRLWNCNDVLFADDQTKITQSADLFYACVNVVRNFSLSRMNKILTQTDPKQSAEFTSLIGKYLPRMPLSAAHTYTIHNLAHAIFAAINSAPISSQERRFAEMDFAEFFINFLQPNHHQDSYSPHMEMYNDALEIIVKSQLWIRQQNDNSAAPSYLTLFPKGS